MRVNYEERKIEEKQINELDYGDSFTVASEYVEGDEPTILIFIEPNFGLNEDHEYAVDVETGNLYRFSPMTKVIVIRSEINVKQP